ncbi:LPXTG cell wall anchor domain-containing protein [Gorillibacterium timonense]|uniref:LPXTG cell wall anchor domain-containing protein n=1 Tax=Gorillibacterium timonense TaxID=1689269 RepID=UPI00071DA0AD|nr:LPXTG cell wall anchor domain-containing protein [Gorillibacterium timonense]
MKKTNQKRVAKLLLCALLVFGLAPILHATAAGLHSTDSHAATEATVTETTYANVLDSTYLNFIDYVRTDGDQNTVFRYALKLPVSPDLFAGSILQLHFDEPLTFVGPAGNLSASQLSLPVDPASWASALSPGLTATVTGNTIEFSFKLVGKFKSDRSFSILIEADGKQKMFTVPAPSREMSGDPKDYGSHYIDMGKTKIVEDPVTGKAKLHLVITGGSATISFSSYRYPLGTVVQEHGEPYELQILHDSISGTYGPGTYDLEIDLPDVGPYQTDLYAGGVLVSPGKDGHGSLYLKSLLQIWDKCRGNALPLVLNVVPGQTKHVWTVTSKLDVPAKFNWQLEGSSQKGSGIVIPAGGQLTLETNRIGTNDKLTVDLLPCHKLTSLAIGDVTPTPTPSETATSTPTPTPSETATSTPTPTPSETATSTPTPTPTETATSTPTPTPSETATSTPTPTPSETATSTPTPTPSETATSTPTPTPSETATSTPTPTPSETATSTPTPTPATASETANSSPSPDTVSPAASPSPSEDEILIDVTPEPIPLGGGETASSGTGTTSTAETLPQTGESLPIGYYAAGLLLIGAGLGTLRFARDRSK